MSKMKTSQPIHFDIKVAEDASSVVRVTAQSCTEGDSMLSRSGSSSSHSGSSSSSSHSSGSFGYDSVCDDDCTTELDLESCAARNCNNNGTRRLAGRWRRQKRRDETRRKLLLKRRNRQNSHSRQQNRPMQQSEVEELSVSESEAEPSALTASNTADELDHLQCLLKGVVKFDINDLNRSIESLMRLNESANCRKKKADSIESSSMTDDVTSPSGVDQSAAAAAAAAPAEQPEANADPEVPYRRSSSAASSDSFASLCPVNTFYDRQHFCPKNRKSKHIKHRQELPKPVVLPRQERLSTWADFDSTARRLMDELRSLHIECQKKRKSVTSHRVERPKTGAKLGSRMENLEALILAMQLTGCRSQKLLRLKKEAAAHNDMLLMVQSQELAERVKRQHGDLERRWNFRRNWAPIAPPSRKMCSAAKDGFVPKGAAVCLDRRDRWLLKFMPERQRGVLPRLLDCGNCEPETPDQAAASAALAFTKARGRLLTACHNLRDPREDAMRRYKYAVLS